MGCFQDHKYACGPGGQGGIADCVGSVVWYGVHGSRR